MVNERANDGWARQPGDQVADTDGLAAERDPLREVDAPRAAQEARTAAMASDPPPDTATRQNPPVTSLWPARGMPNCGTPWSVRTTPALRPVPKAGTASTPATLRPPVAVPAHALGPYGERYGRRKAQMLLRVEATKDLPAKIGGRLNPAKWTPARCDADATRYMFKAFLAHLRAAWRAA